MNADLERVIRMRSVPWFFGLTTDRKNPLGIGMRPFFTIAHGDECMMIKILLGGGSSVFVEVVLAGVPLFAQHEQRHLGEPGGVLESGADREVRVVPLKVEVNIIAASPLPCADGSSGARILLEN